jgi:sialic acid synthase SpsE
MNQENRYTFLERKEPYVIAEIGGNHGGNVEKAKEYATAAAESGVDSVKFQLYQAETLIVEDEPPLPLAGNNYDTQFERFKELELTREEWREVVDLCDSLGVDFSASVFDTELLEFIIDDMPFIKIASGDMTNLPLLRYAAEKEKPILLSTGFSTLNEIQTVIDEFPSSDIIPLHCVGCYPTPEKDANLTMIEHLAEEFDDPVGYSDHTVGTLAPIASVAKGAAVVEKHFTLDKSQEVGDHRLSATPEEMEEIVERTQRVSEMEGERRGNDIYPCEDQIEGNMRRSLATENAIEEGEIIKEKYIAALRPSKGISPLRLDEIVGKPAARDIDEKTILTESDIK